MHADGVLAKVKHGIASPRYEDAAPDRSSIRGWANGQRYVPKAAQNAPATRYQATSNRTRGMLTASDPELYPVVTAEDWVFITNNERTSSASRKRPNCIRG
jgi:hypothetical protein